jgi:hypothetical protein
MDEKNLKVLETVHKLLCQIPVAGMYTVPMAQALLALQNVIENAGKLCEVTTESAGGSARE